MFQLFSHVSSLEHAKKHLHRGQHLIQLLQLFAELRATEKKDKLFAFWGLASGELPAPDYESSTRSVYTSIARWILEDTKDLLLLAIGLPTDPDLPGLPSWVPSLSSPSFEINYFRRRLRCLDAYDCARGITCSMSFEDSGVLCLQGVLVDEIVDVARQAFASEDVAMHAKVLQNWQEFASNCPVGEQLSDDDFCETLVAGCSHRFPEQSPSFPAANPSEINLCKEMLFRMTSGGNFDNDASRFISIRQAHLGACLDRILFRTKAGRLGLGPRSLREGNELWAFGGGPAPFVVRHALKDPERPTYCLVGHAYLHGVMLGDAIDSKTPPRTCRLV